MVDERGLPRSNVDAVRGCACAYAFPVLAAPFQMRNLYVSRDRRYALLLVQ